MKYIFTTAFLVVFALVSSVGGQELTEDVKCVVAGKAAKDTASADYRGGKVYLCCGNCAKTFANDTSKFAVLANHQLVMTGQFEQTGCPISGGDVDPEQAVEVGGVKVAFCCGKCKAKAEGAATEEEKINLVFADAAFEKSFGMKAKWDISNVKCFMMPKRDVKESKVVDHHDGKVFFCCPGCVKKWNKDPEKYSTAANLQLVQTGQYAQTKCPISGGDVDEEQTVEVDGVKVHFCCGNCKGKVESASSDEAKRNPSTIFELKAVVVILDGFFRGFARTNFVEIDRIFV